MMCIIGQLFPTYVECSMRPILEFHARLLLQLLLYCDTVYFIFYILSISIMICRVQIVRQYFRKNSTANSGP